MNQGVEVGAACFEHGERAGTPCARCGTFRCEECLFDGLCPRCREQRGLDAPLPDDCVGFSSRAVSRIIDWVVSMACGAAAGILVVVVASVLEALGLIQEGWTEGWAEGVEESKAAEFLAGVASGVLGGATSTALCGASVGKLLLGQRAVRTDGGLPGFIDSVKRELAFYVDSFFFGLVAHSAMKDSPLKQRLGDRWAGTTVVRVATLAPAARVSPAQLTTGIVAGLAVKVVVMAAIFAPLSG